ncbi:Protein of unknown function, partial [Gryllus bimaculatus]
CALFRRTELSTRALLAELRR